MLVRSRQGALRRASEGRLNSLSAGRCAIQEVRRRRPRLPVLASRGTPQAPSSSANLQRRAPRMCIRGARLVRDHAIAGRQRGHRHWLLRNQRSQRLQNCARSVRCTRVLYMRRRGGHRAVGQCGGVAARGARECKKPRPKPGLSSTDRLADQKSRWMRRRARHSSSLFVVNGQA